MIIARSSKPSWYRTIATAIASVIGSVGVFVLIGFALFFFVLRSDCSVNTAGFYESKGTLCYGAKEINTLTGKGDEKDPLIMKHAILDKDKALVYPHETEPHVIYAEDGKLKFVPYESYKLAQKLYEEYEKPVTSNVDYECRGSSSKRYFNVLTAPVKPNNDGNYAICYRGIDYTQDIAKQSFKKGLAGDGLRITSALKVKGYEIMYVALYNDNTGAAVIEMVTIDSAGKIRGSSNLIDKDEIPGSDADGRFNIFGIIKSKNDFNRIYFNLRNATNITIYQFEAPPSIISPRANVKFFAHGVGFWVGDTGNVSVSKSYVSPETGRYEVSVLLNKNGKEICKLDDSKNYLISDQKCKK
ncbi:hypothetical protein [Xenorhabdus cabanillasii]|uniref:Uncharacterized protein n=1 Tax=Xenorhabdus cabanillasii JM26 TaxID=1427517 RepID=W1IS05_9GAMM|nr:hypothetical protein [Xenorhabdus cabanillasii]PHM75334.1 hypothetical protein Xcab_04190 [Xenorhabdus cabanillasii JM26]CDL79995.1 hypothetical protein XCR1_1310008 [Xenorhabdus cabanillasii JM26]